MKTITLVISPTGETQLQTQGFHGSGCQMASRALEQALGFVTHEQKTAEFYQSAGLQRSEQAKAEG